MNTSNLILTLFPPESPQQLTEDQKSILQHKGGPAWVMAGPGSGKTQILALLVMRLIYARDAATDALPVPPESIFVTTFTNKAANNLQDRISQYRDKVVAAYPELQHVDISKLRIGTLHGLCNDVLQEYRATNYQNVRLMDEFEQALFVREHMSLVKQSDPESEIAFWTEFDWMFQPHQWKPERPYPPSRWNSTRALVSLFNRLVEDRVSAARLREAAPHLKKLAELYDEYLEHLKVNYRCDFAQLQARFLTFLQTPIGMAFRDGNEASLGIKWVLVDEYQDTNPIQEAIYFHLASRTKNLVVVGDDDQAMYRFRGGSVECMVNFDEACEALLEVPSIDLCKYSLVDNFRSHPDIVGFCNDYIGEFPVMQRPRARAAKPRGRPRVNIQQQYPAITRLEGNTLDRLADNFAAMVASLFDEQVINDFSECCLLLKSTRESPRNAEKYVAALDHHGIDVYNPRNKAFADQEEVRSLLGAILTVLDHDRRVATDKSNRWVPSAEAGIRESFDELLDSHAELRKYIGRFKRQLEEHPGRYLDATLQEIVYYLMSHDPFSTWQQDATRRVRMGKITALLESYSSMPVLDPDTGTTRPNVFRGRIRASTQNPGEAGFPWLRDFYHLFLGHVLDTGFDDEEDEDVIVPANMFPIMTMHQSKGLEFPFVFVGHLSEKPKVGPSHRLESLLAAYTETPSRSSGLVTEVERAEMDLIRQYYVAYSRAQYALVLLGTTSQFSRSSIPLGSRSQWVKRRTNTL